MATNVEECDRLIETISTILEAAKLESLVGCQALAKEVVKSIKENNPENSLSFKAANLIAMNLETTNFKLFISSLEGIRGVLETKRNEK